MGGTQHKAGNTQRVQSPLLDIMLANIDLLMMKITTFQSVITQVLERINLIRFYHQRIIIT